MKSQQCLSIPDNKGVQFLSSLIYYRNLKQILENIKSYFILSSSDQSECYLTEPTFGFTTWLPETIIGQTE